MAIRRNKASRWRPGVFAGLLCFTDLGGWIILSQPPPTKEMEMTYENVLGNALCIPNRLAGDAANAVRPQHARKDTPEPTAGP